MRGKLLTRVVGADSSSTRVAHFHDLRLEFKRDDTRLDLEFKRDDTRLDLEFKRDDTILDLDLDVIGLRLYLTCQIVICQQV